MGALYQGLIVTGVLSIGAVWWVINQMVAGPIVTAGGLEIQPMALFWSGNGRAGGSRRPSSS